MSNTNPPNSNALIKLIVERSKEDLNRLTLKIPNNSPFFLDTVDLIKKLPGRQYHSIRKNWSIPFDLKTLDELNLLLGDNLQFTFNWQKALSKMNSLIHNEDKKSHIDSSSNKVHRTIPIKEKTVKDTKNQDLSIPKRRSKSIEKLGKDFGKVILEKDTKFRIKAYVNPCLLYTSPSPRDRQKSRMPSSA